MSISGRQPANAGNVNPTECGISSESGRGLCRGAMARGDDGPVQKTTPMDEILQMLPVVAISLVRILNPQKPGGPTAK